MRSLTMEEAGWVSGGDDCSAGDASCGPSSGDSGAGSCTIADCSNPGFATAPSSVQGFVGTMALTALTTTVVGVTAVATAPAAAAVGLTAAMFSMMGAVAATFSGGSGGGSVNGASGNPAGDTSNHGRGWRVRGPRQMDR